MEPQRFRSIKVPEWVYQNVRRAELALERPGATPLPREVLAPAACPACRGRLDRFELRYEYLTCNRCGYTQQNLATRSNFLGGMVLGIGLALLFQALSEGAAADRPARRRRGAR